MNDLLDNLVGFYATDRKRFYFVLISALAIIFFLGFLFGYEVCSNIAEKYYNSYIQNITSNRPAWLTYS